MKVHTAVLVIALAALASTAAAECVECSQCLTPNCYKYCQPRCDGAPKPSEVQVPLDKCVAKGADAGFAAADGACRAAIVYCNNGKQTKLGAANGEPAQDTVSAGQCSNAAMGSCQRAAADKSPCADMLARGFASCSGEEMAAFWRGQVERRCATSARLMTDVVPGGPDEWASGSQQQQQQQDQQQQQQQQQPQQQQQQPPQQQQAVPQQAVGTGGMSKIVLEIREEPDNGGAGGAMGAPGSVKWSPRRLMAAAARAPQHAIRLDGAPARVFV